MTRFGYTLMTEQAGPRELVRHAAAGESAGFDFQLMSDHYFPWLGEQGRAPYAWSVLGAVVQVTERTELMTYVTCSIRRCHPPSSSPSWSPLPANPSAYDDHEDSTPLEPTRTAHHDVARLRRRPRARHEWHIRQCVFAVR